MSIEVQIAVAVLTFAAVGTALFCWVGKRLDRDASGGADMEKTVKLNDDLIDVARHEAILQDRSLDAQIAHWVRIGRAVETFGKLDYAKVSAVLAGEMQTRNLSDEEKSVWMDRFTDLMGEPGPDEEAFFADRRRRVAELEAELAKRLETPLGEWERVDSPAECVAHAHEYLDREKENEGQV